MQYHLDTIPVWEAMETPCGCVMCRLSQKTEQLEIERSLGGSVMEPASRIRVNERGICQKHHRQLYEQKNRLGHALLTDSHTKECLSKLSKLTPAASGGSGLRGLFSGSSDSPAQKLAEALEVMTGSCVICDALSQHMSRYLYTFLHLWKTDAKFKAAWDASQGVCLVHGAALLRQCPNHLSAAQQKEFAASLLMLVRNALEQEEKDLEWFTLKFDYRNQDKPWGNSKTALERTINRLRGRCLGEE